MSFNFSVLRVRALYALVFAAIMIGGLFFKLAVCMNIRNWLP